MFSGLQCRFQSSVNEVTEQRIRDAKQSFPERSGKRPAKYVQASTSSGVKRTQYLGYGNSAIVRLNTSKSFSEYLILFRNLVKVVGVNNASV